MQQWLDRIEQFLGIPKDRIGVIGGGQKARFVGAKVTVATVQTLYKLADQVAPHIGFLVVDEAHRTPSRTFSEAVSAFDSRYMLGLSATPWRRDKLSRLIYWYLGDMAHQVDKEALEDSGDVLKAEVIWRETCFSTTLDPSEQYSKMLSELTQDRERNAMIASDVAGQAQNGGGACLVLSDRKNHCEAIQASLCRDFGVDAEILTGDVSAKDRQTIVGRLNTGQVKVVCATGQLIGEGFDAKALQTLFLVTPIKFSGRLIQYLGRVLRPAPAKDRATVFDYVDPVGVLKASAKARRRVYER